MTKRVSPEQVSESRRATSLKRWHPDAAPATPPTKPAGDPPRLESIIDYDKTLGAPRTWTDARAREAVVAELIANERLRDEVSVYRKSLLTSEQVAARDEERDEAVLGVLATLPEVLAALVPAETRNEARKAGRQLIADLRKLIAGSLSRKPDAG